MTSAAAAPKAATGGAATGAAAAAMNVAVAAAAMGVAVAATKAADGTTSSIELRIGAARMGLTEQRRHGEGAAGGGSTACICRGETCSGADGQGVATRSRMQRFGGRAGLRSVSRAVGEVWHRAVQWWRRVDGACGASGRRGASACGPRGWSRPPGVPVRGGGASARRDLALRWDGRGVRRWKGLIVWDFWGCM